MSGGSKGEMAPTQSAAVQGVPPAYLKNTSSAQIPAFMPGQQEALASQLSAGFGATPKAFADYISKVYQPAQTLNFGVKPPAAAPAPKANPLALGGNRGGGTAVGPNFSNRDRQQLIAKYGYDPTVSRR